MAENKSLIVHICCGPCLSGLSDYLKKLGFDRITGYFYNPNIHPYREFKQRRNTVRMNEELFGFDSIEYSDDYPLRDTLDNMLKSSDRCEYCFRSRLTATAQLAVEKDITHFTTTLLISPYQKQDILVKIGNEIAQKYNLSFLSEDLKRFYELSREISHQHDMYRQGYCGCIFSELERYKPKTKTESCRGE